MIDQMFDVPLPPAWASGIKRGLAVPFGRQGLFACGNTSVGEVGFFRDAEDFVKGGFRVFGDLFVGDFALQLVLDEFQRHLFQCSSQPK